MTQRALNWYISARARMRAGYSVQVCSVDDESYNEVKEALITDDLTVRIENGILWVGEGPDVVNAPTENNLLEIKANKLAELKIVCDGFVASRYPIQNQIAMLSIQNRAIMTQNMAVLNELMKLATWQRTVIMYYDSLAAQVEAATNESEINTIVFDATVLIATDPMLSIIALEQKL